MTRTAVSPEELDSPDPADPRLHAKRDLAPVWRHPRGRPPLRRQPERTDQPGFWMITRNADATAVYRGRDRRTTERGNALANFVLGGGSMLAVTDGLRHRGECDVVQDVTATAPLGVICDLLARPTAALGSTARPPRGARRMPTGRRGPYGRPTVSCCRPSPTSRKRGADTRPAT